MSGREVERWFKRVDHILAFHRAVLRFQSCRFGFELWTIRGFHDEALELLMSEGAQRTKITVKWRNGYAVREYAVWAGRKSLVKALDQHYFNDPLGA